MMRPGFDQPKEMTSPIKAGFPNPADGALSTPLDLNQLIVRHPISTYFLRVSGDSMMQSGITPGDIAVIDRALTPKTGDIVVAAVEGEFVIRHFKQTGHQAWLVTAEGDSVALHETQDASVWGVVSYIIHSTRKAA